MLMGTAKQGDKIEQNLLFVTTQVDSMKHTKSQTN